MPKTPTLPTLPKDAVRPFYAVAGATDLAVELARGYVESVRSVDLKPKAIPSKVEAYVNDTVSDLNETYGELATRGEHLVSRIRRQQSTQDAKAAVKTTTSRAKAARTTAKKSASATKSRAKATGTTAKKAAAKTSQAAVDASEKVGD